jgi:hypothetical protein
LQDANGTLLQEWSIILLWQAIESIPPADRREGIPVCRNIKPLFNFEPPVTDEEIRAAALQFVRKVSGFNKPSMVNEAVFNAAVSRVAAASRNLLNSLETSAPPRNRAEMAARARARAAKRFSPRAVRGRES